MLLRPTCLALHEHLSALGVHPEANWDRSHSHTSLFVFPKIDDFLAAGTRCVEGCLVGTGQVDTMLRFAHAWAVPIFRRSSHLSFAKLPASLGQAISVMFAALINT